MAEHLAAGRQPLHETAYQSPWVVIIGDTVQHGYVQCADRLVEVDQPGPIGAVEYAVEVPHVGYADRAHEH